MSQRIVPSNAQEIQVSVSGPEDANRLILCSGDANVFVQATNDEVNTSWSFLVGPILQRRQFLRAIISSGLTKFGIGAVQADGALNVGAHWTIVSADADWDDESGQVEVRVEINVNTQGSSSTVNAYTNGISYHVSILAALP